MAHYRKSARLERMWNQEKTGWLRKQGSRHPCPGGGIVSGRKGVNKLELWPVNQETCLVSISDVKYLEVMINSQLYIRAEVKLKDLLLELS